MKIPTSPPPIWCNQLFLMAMPAAAAALQEQRCSALCKCGKYNHLSAVWCFRGWRFCPIAFVVVFHGLIGEANARNQNQAIKLI